MISKNDLKDLILECSDDEFNREHLLDDQPWYFTRPDAPCDYATFQKAIAGVFKVKAHDVALIGSGYFGRSLSPDKPFQKYRLNKTASGKKSDLDVIIISKEYFELIWSDLLSAHYAGQHYVFNRYAKTTFKKFVSFDKNIQLSNKGAIRVSTKFDRMLKIYNDVSRETTTTFSLKNEIKFRVYRNRGDVLAYHNWSIANFRKAIS